MESVVWELLCVLPSVGTHDIIAYQNASQLNVAQKRYDEGVSHGMSCSKLFHARNCVKHMHYTLQTRQDAVMSLCQWLPVTIIRDWRQLERTSVQCGKVHEPP